jgi:membrane fusion protein (multidrug efflux system)
MARVTYVFQFRMRSFGFLFLLITIAACRRSDDAAAAPPPREASRPVHVQTVAVTSRPVPEYLPLTGTLRANSSSDVAADVSGKVVATFVERGQQVKQGQTIAIVDARTAALAARAAEAQTKVAQSQLEEARRECERVKHLLDTGAISQADFDRQSAQCTSQQWSAAAAEAQQKTASKLLGDSVIRAPFSGYVGERYVNVGQYVQPSTRVASVYSPDPLRLELTVPEASVAIVQQGVPVDFSVAAFGDRTFRGSVAFISPNVRESTRDLVVEAVVPNADLKLRPGMFAVAKIRRGEKPNPVVPPNAIVQDDTGARVFVVVGGQVQERLVQLGENIGDAVAVADGVKQGENVVVSPGPDVHDGVRVE